jgi:ankyrin repeat domain-containing protein 50
MQTIWRSEGLQFKVSLNFSALWWNSTGLPASKHSRVARHSSKWESDVEMKKISRETDVFIKSKVHDIGARLGLRCDEQNLLLRELMRALNRTYLWVHLTLDLIESDIDIDKIGIVNATSHLPKTVD